MRPMPTVSYVVTVYNKALYLPFVVEGLKRQEGDFEREFIFVDDGSTDDSLAILKRLTAGWSDVSIIEQENQGPAPATNAGFERATGDYIKPVDGDDVLYPWTTAVLLSAIEQTGAGVSYAQYRLAGVYDADRRADAVNLLDAVIREAGRMIVHERPLKHTVKFCQMTPTAWLARSNLVREARGCDETVFVQDNSIGLRLARLSAQTEVKEPLYMIPKAIGARITSNNAQLRHDENTALAGFIRDYPDLPRNIRVTAYRSAAKRAWQWDKQNRISSILSANFWRYILARCLRIEATPARIEKTCHTFRKSADIRIPPARPE